MGAERRGALTKTTRIKNSPVLDSEESHEAAAESKVEKEERAILHRFLQADGKNAQDNADDGPTHEEYADFLQLVAPDQTRLDESRRTRNVQEHAGTLFCSINSCKTSATRLFCLFWLNRSSALQYEMEAKQLHIAAEMISTNNVYEGWTATKRHSARICDKWLS